MITDNPDGQPVTVLTFETGWTRRTASPGASARRSKTSKRRYRDFAVFLRINALSRGLETAFVKQRVPFQIVKGLAFFERKENRDVLAYLRLLLNPRDDLSFLRSGQRTSARHRQGVAGTSAQLRRAARNELARRRRARSPRSPRSRARRRPACAISPC